MFKLRTIVVLICATSVLTLSVNKTETDNLFNETRGDPNIEHLHSSLKLTNKSEINLPTFQNDTHPASLSGVGAKIQQPETTDSSSIVTSNTVPTPRIVAEGIALTPEDLLSSDSKSKLPKIRTASVVARKGAIPPSKITPRKGVGLESSVLAESSMEGIDEAVHSIQSSVDKSSKKIEQLITKSDEKNDTKKVTIEPKLATKFISGVPSSVNEAHTIITLNSTTISTLESSTAETKIAESTSSTLSSKRFKPKPTVTIGEMDIDKPIPASPTKTPPLGMPRKIDYIVPVMITIMALPLLGAVTFFLYRRGRDCWDKRHYRRMDFLIDGMYNDHSWK